MGKDGGKEEGEGGEDGGKEAGSGGEEGEQSECTCSGNASKRINVVIERKDGRRKNHPHGALRGSRG